MLISQRAFGRRIGVSQEAVRCAIKAGRISTIRGKIDPVAAERQWLKNTDQSKPRNRITGDPKHRRDPKRPAQPMDLGRSAARGGNGSSADYSKARAAREVYLAQLAKLDLERRLGNLMPTEEARRALSDSAGKTRDQLLALPERVATIIAAIDDAAEVQRILEEEIERICKEISGADGL